LLFYLNSIRFWYSAQFHFKQNYLFFHLTPKISGKWLFFQLVFCFLQFEINWMIYFVFDFFWLEQIKSSCLLNRKQKHSQQREPRWILTQKELQFGKFSHCYSKYGNNSIFNCSTDCKCNIKLMGENHTLKISNQIFMQPKAYQQFQSLDNSC
jgi:hypothetical protein